MDLFAMNMTYFCQADTDHSYTSSQLWIATNLVLTFQLVSCTAVNVLNRYEYGECILLFKWPLVTLTNLPNS